MVRRNVTRGSSLNILSKFLDCVTFFINPERGLRVCLRIVMQTVSSVTHHCKYIIDHGCELDFDNSVEKSDLVHSKSSLAGKVLH